MNDKEEKDIENAIDTLIRSINVMGGEQEVKERVVSTMRIQHRTLKQNFMRDIILPIISAWAKDYRDGNYDLRNSETCKLCNEIEKIAKNHPLPFI